VSRVTPTAYASNEQPMRERVVAILSRNKRAIRDALMFAGTLRALWWVFAQGINPFAWLGLDTRAYWRVNLDDPYRVSGVGQASTFLYSPAFAQVLAPFGALPFELFYGIWTAVSIAILVWLVRPWPWAIGIFALPIVQELSVGNIHFLLAASCIVGFRYPAIWAFGIFAKVTPGVALLWFLVRREWKALAGALLITGLIAAVSFVIAPSLWFDWFQVLGRNTGGGELLLPRLALAALLVTTGALLDRRAFVPVAVWIALPVVWVNSWVILLACIRLLRDDQERERRPMLDLENPRLGRLVRRLA
jgi:Glycosyltransferase family 87